jgi:hypothetical protein
MVEAAAKSTVHGFGQTSRAASHRRKKGVKESSSFPEVSCNEYEVSAVDFVVAVYIAVQIPSRAWR